MKIVTMRRARLLQIGDDAPEERTVMSDDTCTFCFEHDPETLAPKGDACKAPGVDEIHWKDGRISVACREHGLDALDEEARAEVFHVVPLGRSKPRAIRSSDF